MTLMTTHPALARSGTTTDPHAHHRREALALHRSRRRARRRTRLASLRTTLGAASASITLIRMRDAEPSAVGSGGRVDL